MEIGIFLTPDSLVPDPTNPQAFNRYAYVLNNPIRYTDPTGHYYSDLSDAGGDDWDSSMGDSSDWGGSSSENEGSTKNPPSKNQTNTNTNIINVIAQALYGLFETTVPLAPPGADIDKNILIVPNFGEGQI